MKAEHTPEKDPHIRRMDEALNEPVLDHDYDGIEELDNPLPGWWLATFYITIVVGVVYFAYHNILNPADVHAQRYASELQVYEQAQAEKNQAQAVTLTPEQMLEKIKDPAVIEAGSALYNERCISCHAAGGAGQIGPNLTDDFWINGDGKPLTIQTLIDKGVTTKGMPAWEAVFSDQQLVEITAYVVSLRGSNPPNAKAPQGDKKEL